MNENNNNRKWKEFGDFLKQERDKRKYSRKYLAQNLAKTEATVASWEHGLRRPRNETLLPLSNFLRISIQELQAKAGYTPEFDWINALTKKPDNEEDILEDATPEEKKILAQYLHFLRFAQQVKKQPQKTNISN
jgi:transcriptional regulator with XRE-family HTH domain